MLSGRLLLGQYKPGNGISYRLDPRTKILLVIAIMLAVLLHTNIAFYGGLITVLALILIIDGPGWKQVYGNLKPIFWLVLFTALIHLLFSGRNDPNVIFHLSWLSITKKAAVMAVTFSLRIVIFVLATFLISLTTSPLSISEGIVSLLKPLRLLKIPIHDLGMILFIALRFIPVLSGEMEMIRKAQYIRGVDFSGKWLQKIKNSVALVIPVFFSALRRADELSIAIEARGYQSGKPRSSLYPLVFRPLDIAVLMTATLILLAIILWRFVWAA
ncbi:MAG: energy-coupling factor transporter transmembrane component T [Candidatus Zixiibacteriota bacterium]